MTKLRNYTGTLDKTKPEDGSEESGQGEHPQSCLSKRRTANSGCVSIIERSMKSPKRIDIRYLSSAKYSTDWQEPNTLPSWTSRTLTITFGSRRETNTKLHLRPS